MRLVAVVVLVAVGVHAVTGQYGQASTDGNAWANLPGKGASGRPWIVSLSVSTNGTTTAAWTDATGPSTSPPTGYEAVQGRFIGTVNPINMCSTGQTPGNGCYATPNRVGISFGCTMGSSNAPVAYDFLDAQNPCKALVNVNSVIDVTVDLNSFTDAFQWTWINGDLLYWSTSTSSSGSTLVHMRVRPVLSPVFAMDNIPQPNCCTCDMPSNCNMQNTTGYQLLSNLFFHCQNKGLTGAAFATRNAMMGAMAQAHGGNGIDYRLASAHKAPDGKLLKGSLRAFVPLSTITSLYPSITTLSSAVASINMTRSSTDGGSQDTIAITAWTSASNGADGVCVDVTGVTFSTPTYTMSVAGTETAAHSSAQSISRPSLLISILVLSIAAPWFV
ncbi:Uncharacterized protein PBTT_07486 [Plasmodiophora brassicae]